MFTQETFDILVENRLNDSKMWYEEHKPDIRRLVLEPFFELIEKLGPTVLSIDPEIVVEPKVDRTLSRIYRDTRFRKDKSKYRDSMWLFFRRDKRIYPGYPNIFFEITPAYIWWGCGVNLYDSNIAESYRKLILDRSPVFLEAKAAYEAQDRFVLSEDSRLKRTKFPDEPEDIRRWLDLKGVYIAHTENDTAFAFDEKLVDTLKKDFLSTAPLYNFFRIACDLKNVRM